MRQWINLFTIWQHLNQKQKNDKKENQRLPKEINGFQFKNYKKSTSLHYWIYNNH